MSSIYKRTEDDALYRSGQANRREHKEEGNTNKRGTQIRGEQREDGYDNEEKIKLE